ncbi:hypothetical protein NODU109028_11990 [Nocardioides dubius]|uniref:Bacterial Ig domain-containing protein n=1 Tax=Nocardioides dubius TaxID=317019 RepID=A0ABN1TRH8_9ACTN
MSIKRFVTGAVAAGLLGLTPIALAAAPAQAATPSATAIAGQISKSKTEYGDSFYISGNVQSEFGYPTGTLTLSRKLAGESSYKVVGTDTSPGYFWFDLKAAGNATYVLSFSGGSDSQYDYQPSSISTKQSVFRKVTVKTNSRTMTAKGKVTPSFGKKKILVQIKKGGWKTFKRVKTDKAGKYSVRLPGKRGKGNKYRLVIKADKRFVTNNYHTITSRIY